MYQKCRPRGPNGRIIIMSAHILSTLELLKTREIQTIIE